MKSRKDENFFPKHSSCWASALGRITRGSHITPLQKVCSLLHRASEICKSLVLQDKCNIEIYFFSECRESFHDFFLGSVDLIKLSKNSFGNTVRVSQTV